MFVRKLVTFDVEEFIGILRKLIEVVNNIY